MTSKDEIYKNIDYTLIYSKANEYLAITSVIEVFPYKVKAFVEEQSDIRLCTYSKAMTKFGIDVKSFGSESAVIQEYCGFTFMKMTLLLREFGIILRSICLFCKNMRALFVLILAFIEICL